MRKSTSFTAYVKNLLENNSYIFDVTEQTKRRKLLTTPLTPRPVWNIKVNDDFNNQNSAQNVISVACVLVIGAGFLYNIARA